MLSRLQQYAGWNRPLLIFFFNLWRKSLLLFLLLLRKQSKRLVRYHGYARLRPRLPPPAMVITKSPSSAAFTPIRHSHATKGSCSSNAHGHSPAPCHPLRFTHNTRSATAAGGRHAARDGGWRSTFRAVAVRILTAAHAPPSSFVPAVRRILPNRASPVTMSVSGRWTTASPYTCSRGTYHYQLCRVSLPAFSALPAFGSQLTLTKTRTEGVRLASSLVGLSHPSTCRTRRRR